jgi:hypothetical protein
MRFESSIVRIRKPDDEKAVVGAGFLIGGEYVLTCAHVVTDALGLPRDLSEAPQSQVCLDFYLLGEQTCVPASVFLWCAFQPSGGGDIAVLKIEGVLPQGAKPACLARTGAHDLWNHKFRAVGFPHDNVTGAWVEGGIRGHLAHGWIQIEDAPETAYHVKPGFSGGPVWDEQLRAVVGMIAAAEPEGGAASIIPIDVLIAEWPILEQHLAKPRTICFKYACFVSYHHSQGQYKEDRRALESFSTLLSREIDLLFDRQMYIDMRRLEGVGFYDEALAQALCESVCMIVIYTPRYFDSQHTFCTREYRAMEALEAQRLALLPDPADRQHWLIIPVIFRGEKYLPQELRIRTPHRFDDFLLSSGEISKHPRCAKTVRDIAEYIYDRCRTFEEIPEAFDGCSEFTLPEESAVLPYLDELKHKVLLQSRFHGFWSSP